MAGFHCISESSLSFFSWLFCLKTFRDKQIRQMTGQLISIRIEKCIVLFFLELENNVFFL